MADTEWKPLPAGLWTLPAVFMEAGNLLLEAFMESAVPSAIIFHFSGSLVFSLTFQVARLP